MSAIAEKGRAAFRKYEIDGVASTGFHKPDHDEIREFVDEVDRQVEDLRAEIGVVTTGIRWTTQTIRVRATGNVNLASGLENNDTLNGVTLATGDHVFLGSQSDPAQNGIYTVVASGSASRATFADSASELAQIAFVIQEGTVGVGERWVLPLDESDITVGTTALNFALIGIEPGYASEVETARGGEASLDARLDKLAVGDYAHIQRGVVAGGTDLSTITKPGTYFLSADGGYTSIPDDMVVGQAHWLFIANYGNTVGAGSARYIHQRIESFSVNGTPPNVSRNRWIRRLDTENPTSTAAINSWVPLHSSARPASELTAQRGTIEASTDLGTIWEPGTYLGLANGGYESVPDGHDTTQAFWLEVANYGGTGGSGNGRFVKQTLTEMLPVGTVRRKFERRLDTNSPSSSALASAWLPIHPVGATSFSGKTIVCFGDSITEGGGGGYEFPPILASRLGANVINGGFGGCRMAVHDSMTLGELYDPMSMYRISERIANDDWSVLVDAADALYNAEGDDNRQQAADLAGLDWSTVDYGIIFYGTNDFRGTGGMGVPIGDDSDDDGTTFKGAINVTIENILTARPNIKLMFVTPLYRSRVATTGDDSDVTANGSGLYLRDYSEAIIERAQAFRIPVFDLHAECGVNMLNHEYYLSDGLHPFTTPGIQLVGDKIAAALMARY